MHSKDRLRIDIQAGSGKPVVKYAEQRWALLVGEHNWEELLPHIGNPLYRTRGEEIMYKKILTRRLEVNHYKTSSKADRLCSYCNKEETIEHLYAECTSTRAFLAWLREFMSVKLNREFDIPQITLRDIVYFFPKLTPLLNAGQLRCVGIAHSIAIVALWEARGMESRPEFAIDYFSERFTVRIESDSTRRESDSSDVPSLSKSSANTSNWSGGSTPEKDFTDILQEVLKSNLPVKEPDQVLGSLLALYE